MRTKIITPIIVFFAILLTPTPCNISEQAWKMFAIFCTTICGLILKPYPMGAVALIGMTLGSLIGAFSIKEAVAGFGSILPWQIVGVFFIARAFVSTGLAKRIAYHIVNLLGKNVLGLGYGFLGANLIASPLVPSSGARIGGIIFPIVKAICQALGSDPENGTQKRIGSFYTLLCLYGNSIIGGTFLTAMTGNFIAQGIALANGIKISWIEWFILASIPALVCLGLIPLLLYAIYKPELTDISETRKMIQQEITKLGKLSLKEMQMIAILLLVFIGWVFGDIIKLDTILTTYIGVTLLICTKIISFEHDLLGDKEAWHTLIWLAILIMMSQKLETLGFLEAISARIESTIEIFPAITRFSVLMIIYFYTHYLFASNSSHISAMYGVFLVVALKLGVTPLIAALSLAYASNIFAGLTYYSSLEAVVLYNSHYASARDFLFYGFILSTFSFAVWFTVGAVWWKILGIY